MWGLIKKTWNLDDVPDKNFERLLKAAKECPETAAELDEKAKREEHEKQRGERNQPNRE